MSSIFIATAGSIYFNLHLQVWENDKTKLSFLILGLFYITSVYIGWKTYWNLQRFNIGWFIAEACLALGMIGTLTGFLLMLGAAFGNLVISDPASIQLAISSMAIGMSTALYTTLVGLICSLLLKVQLVTLEHE
tara:strand:- start:12806 stop:13207 length:402 start_codon:yes stop_codon:yes gene_type:complete